MAVDNEETQHGPNRRIMTAAILSTGWGFDPRKKKIQLKKGEQREIRYRSGGKVSGKKKEIEGWWTELFILFPVFIFQQVFLVQKVQFHLN